MILVCHRTGGMNMDYAHVRYHSNIYHGNKTTHMVNYINHIKTEYYCGKHLFINSVDVNASELEEILDTTCIVMFIILL